MYRLHACTLNNWAMHITRECTISISSLRHFSRDVVWTTDSHAVIIIIIRLAVMILLEQNFWPRHPWEREPSTCFIIIITIIVVDYNMDEWPTGSRVLHSLKKKKKFKLKKQYITWDPVARESALFRWRRHTRRRIRLRAHLQRFWF